jgi:hypothetical protein
MLALGAAGCDEYSLGVNLFMGNLIGIAFYGAFIVAWITHVVVCIQNAAWALLVIGALMFPIGVIHGFMIWLGIPWA